jgi:hypothetical protein
MIPVYDDPLSAEDWKRIRATPTSPEAAREMLELIRWFCARYPTPAARLAYVRRRMKRHGRT